MITARTEPTSSFGAAKLELGSLFFSTADRTELDQLLRFTTEHFFYAFFWISDQIPSNHRFLNFLAVLQTDHILERSNSSPKNSNNELTNSYHQKKQGGRDRNTIKNGSITKYFGRRMRVELYAVDYSIGQRRTHYSGEVPYFLSNERSTTVFHSFDVAKF